MHKIIYICHSNKGRSPALAVYTRRYLHDLGVERVTVDSAGIGLESIFSLRNRGMDYASRNTIKILEEQGFNLSENRLKYAGEVIHGSSLVLATDLMTLLRTQDEFPDYAKKTFLATAYAGFSVLDVHGPHSEKRKKKLGGHWNELMGYRDMLWDLGAIAKKIAERIAREK